MITIYDSIYLYKDATAEQHADKLKGVLHYAQNLTRSMLASINGESSENIDIDNFSGRILQIEETVFSQYRRYGIASAAAGEPSPKRAEIVSRVMTRLFETFDRFDAAMHPDASQTAGYSL